MTKEPNDTSLQLPEAYRAVQQPLLAGGLVAIVAGMLIGTFMTDNGISHSMHAYLTAFMFCMTISLGALFFVIIQHLCRAGWSASVRRLAEIMMAAIPLLAVLFAPIVFYVLFLDNGQFYPWNAKEWLEEKAPASYAKAMILDGFPYLMVTAVVFGVWSMIARYYWQASLEQDQSGDVSLTARMQKWSGPSTMLFSLSVTAAAFIWVMSLDPMWFSTMFGVYLFAGSMLSFFAMMSVAVFMLQKNGAIQDEVNEEHFHDLGKFTFGFIVFWAYIAFSQYMLIWYGNIPEETIWLMHRQAPPGTGISGWSYVSIALVLLHWLVPFFAIMSRHVRRWPKWMACWGIYLLLMHYMDLYWVIMPEAGILEEGTSASPVVFGGMFGLISSLLCLGGMFSLYVGLLLRLGTGIPLIPVKDPRLSQALHFENI